MDKGERYRTIILLDWSPRPVKKKNPGCFAPPGSYLMGLIG